MDTEATHPAVRRTKRVAWLLDDAIRIPGTNRRVGLDPVIGAIPVIGDVFTGILSLYIIVEAVLAGVRKRTLLRMVLNLLIDVLGGALPFVGDLFDAYWKANVRNRKLLERSLS